MCFLLSFECFKWCGCVLWCVGAGIGVYLVCLVSLKCLLVF